MKGGVCAAGLGGFQNLVFGPVWVSICLPMSLMRAHGGVQSSSLTLATTSSRLFLLLMMMIRASALNVQNARMYHHHQRWEEPGGCRRESFEKSSRIFLCFLPTLVLFNFDGLPICSVLLLDSSCLVISAKCGTIQPKYWAGFLAPGRLGAQCFAWISTFSPQGLVLFRL